MDINLDSFADMIKQARFLVVQSVLSKSGNYLKMLDMHNKVNKKCMELMLLGDKEKDKVELTKNINSVLTRKNLSDAEIASLLWISLEDIYLLRTGNITKFSLQKLKSMWRESIFFFTHG